MVDSLAVVEKDLREKRRHTPVIAWGATDKQNYWQGRASVSYPPDPVFCEMCCHPWYFHKFTEAQILRHIIDYGFLMPRNYLSHCSYFLPPFCTNSHVEVHHLSLIALNTCRRFVLMKTCTVQSSVDEIKCRVIISTIKTQ